MGKFHCDPYPAYDEGVADLEIRFQIMAQSPPVVEDDGIGPAKIMDVISIVVEIDASMAAGDVGIAQHNIAGWVPADRNALIRIDGFSLFTSTP